MATPSTPAANSDLKWSLRDMLVATVIIAAFLAIANYLGFKNPLLWTCTIASAILALFCATSIPYKRYVSPLVMTGLILFFLCNPFLMFFSLVMAINGVSHVVFTLVAKQLPTPPTVRRVLTVSFTLTLISFSIGVLVSLPSYQKAELAKERYRPIDLSQRLSYENAETTQVIPKVSTTAPAKVDPAEAYFTEAERMTGFFRGRKSNLEALHNGRLDFFVRSPGFGIGRFFAPSTERIDYPETQNLPFTLVADQEFQEMRKSLWELQFGLPQVTSHQTLHVSSVLAFAHPSGTGAVTEPKVAVGFEPHAMQLPPQNLAKNFLKEQQLNLESLQLVSLHRFETPRAYVLDHLPRMDQLIGEDVPTRELSKFERSAIETLGQTTTDDIVTEVTDDGLAMVGSVRAYESCLECHAGNKGDLLGAFSYTFRENADQNNEPSQD